MKRRVRKIANFFAFNLLFFALYLNFIHKDKRPAVVNNMDQTVQQNNTPAFGGTVLVDNPEQYLPKKETGAPASNAATETKTEQGSTAALKLSIN